MTDLEIIYLDGTSEIITAPGAFPDGHAEESAVRDHLANNGETLDEVDYWHTRNDNAPASASDDGWEHTARFLAERPPTVGRPRLSDDPTVIVSVTMPKPYRLFLERMDRNTSAAIRLLIELAMERTRGE